MNTASEWPEYRKIETIRATQINGPEDLPAGDERVSLSGHDGFYVATLEGGHEAGFGDWLACGASGDLWPIRDHIFRQTYRPVDDKSWTTDDGPIPVDQVCDGRHGGPCKGPTWQCPDCLSWVCYEEGADDDEPDLCDRCWGRRKGVLADGA